MAIAQSEALGRPRPVGTHGLLLLGMPSWDVSKPFHALAVVAGIARESAFPVSIRDVNIDFYRTVSDEEKKYWSPERSHLWLSEKLQDELWAKYTPWVTGYLDRALEEADPRLVAFSVNMWTRPFSIRAARYIKKCRPDLPILFGGVDCFPKEHNKRFLQDGSDRYCDIICQGEAEISFKRYLQELAATGDWRANCPGFAYYDDGRLIDTGDTELPTLKGDQPRPAYDLFDLSQYFDRGSLPFFLTRGCVYNCHFCSEKPNFRRFRARDAEEAVRELEAILPYAQPLAPIPTLNLADSNFNADMRRLKEFVELILQKGIRVRWGGQAHIDPRVTSEFIDKLAKAGLVSVFWGIETGSQHVVDLMNKRYHHPDARRILRECSRAGIAQFCPIILGFPGETAEDVAETIDFILEFQDLPLCQFAAPGQIVVRPNSPLHDRYAEFGLANSSYYEWCTCDGTNSLPIRIVRRFVVQQAHANRDFSMERLVDAEEIRNLRLNETNTASDLYRLLKELFRRAGCLHHFYEALDNWREPPRWFRLFFSARAARERKDYAAVFQALDKDSADGRKRLYQLILESVQALKMKMSERSAAAA